MTVKNLKSSSGHAKNWIIGSIIILIGLTIFLVLNSARSKNQKERNISKLELVHKRATNQFSNAIDRFAGIVSGMNSYVNQSENLPTPLELQNFVNNQLNQLQMQDDLIVSFIDTNQVFQYNFSRTKMDPFNLTGRDVKGMRSADKINKLDALMNQENLFLFNPINLIEGYPGLSINFRVNREGKTLGYIAPLLNFKTIIQSLYDDGMYDDYVFHFSTEEGHDFDRESVHDGSTIYNSARDDENYKNYNLSEKDFIYSDLEMYGLKLKVGTARKENLAAYDSFFFILLFWFLTFVVFILIITVRSNRIFDLNKKILHSNLYLKESKLEITSQNYELKKLSNTKDKFLSIIGHDVRAPLNSIQGLISLLELQQPDDDSLKGIFKDLKTSTKNTVNLLDNLLKWARSQSDDIDFNSENLVINDLIHEVLELLKPQALDKNLEISTTLKNKIHFHGDKNMIITVIRNLVSNAIKFNNSGGEIVVEAKIVNDKLEVSVEDNGIGMKSNVLSKLFDLDKQLSTKGTRGEIGTGLGLLLCSEFILKHKGNLLAESTEGVGTTFTFSIPIDDVDSSSRNSENELDKYNQNSLLEMRKSKSKRSPKSTIRKSKKSLV